MANERIGICAVTGSWKQRERDVADWFGTVRNPLSGKNSRADDGSRRPGDIVLPGVLVEVKRRKKSSVVMRAKATRWEANREKLPWAHFEFATSQPDIVSLCTDIKTMKFICEKLKEYWGNK